jgi:hypothetical protein
MMIYALTAPDPAQKLLLFRQVFGRDKQRRGLPDGLNGRISKKQFRSGIPGRNMAIKTKADYGEPGRIQGLIGDIVSKSGTRLPSLRRPKRSVRWDGMPSRLLDR